ncbi:MAG: hypothetical protein HXY44_14425 [Syntrophaceae bacterium]|nr:hypothetical protein [Syntrophaceae bacterium]
MKLKSREKILAGLAVLAMAIWAFDHFYYTPQARKIQMLKAEIKEADLKLTEYQQIAQGVEFLESEILRREEEFKKVSQRMLRGEEFRTFLKHLAGESMPPQMKVISLIPQEEIVPSSEGKKEISGSHYKKVNIKMVLYSTFSKLGTYMKGIEELPFLIHVDSLQVEKNEEVHPLLKVTMGLGMYVTLEGTGYEGPRNQRVQ